MKWRSSINYKNRILLNLECTKFLLDIILNKIYYIILIVLSRLQLVHLQLIQYFYFTDKIIRYVIWNNQYLNKKKIKQKLIHPQKDTLEGKIEKQQMFVLV